MGGNPKLEKSYPGNEQPTISKSFIILLSLLFFYYKFLTMKYSYYLANFIYLFIYGNVYLTNFGGSEFNGWLNQIFSITSHLLDVEGQYECNNKTDYTTMFA